jgi:hypothetical protein
MRVTLAKSPSGFRAAGGFRLSTGDRSRLADYLRYALLHHLGSHLIGTPRLDRPQNAVDFLRSAIMPRAHHSTSVVGAPLSPIRHGRGGYAPKWIRRPSRYACMRWAGDSLRSSGGAPFGGRLVGLSSADSVTQSNVKHFDVGGVPEDSDPEISRRAFKAAIVEGSSAFRPTLMSAPFGQHVWRRWSDFGCRRADGNDSRRYHLGLTRQIVDRDGLAGLSMRSPPAALAGAKARST